MANYLAVILLLMAYLAVTLATNNYATDPIITSVTTQRVSRVDAAPVLSKVGQVEKIPVTPLSLEAAKEPPKNIYTPDNPYEATVVSIETLVEAPGETCQLVLEHDQKFPIWEGQTLDVIIPGSKQPPFQFSSIVIASTRYGDHFDGNTLTLSIRRLKGSFGANYLCKRQIEDKVLISGPGITKLLLPHPLDQDAKFIMVATGILVSPFRAHLRRLFMEDIPNLQFNGFAWLFHEVANTRSLLYKDEFTQYRRDYPYNFLYNYVRREEDRNKHGEKMYIQDAIEDHAAEILVLLEKGAIIYFAVLDNRMPKIEAVFERVLSELGINGEEKIAHYKANGQWREQPYSKTELDLMDKYGM